MSPVLQHHPAEPAHDLIRRNGTSNDPAICKLNVDAAREEEECYRGNRRRSIGKMNAVFHPWPIREFRDRSDGIPESGVQGRFSSAHEIKHGGLSYRAETMDGLEAHLGEGGQLGHHNSAISRCRFRRAGATGGGREGRPRQSRILRAAAGSSIAARIRIRPPQRGHSSTSTAKILAISWDQL